jgi:ATP-dependent protease ClpP protease subunit
MMAKTQTFKQRINEDDDNELIVMQQPSSRMYRKVQSSNCIDYYLDDAIEDVSEYRDILHALRNANQNDIVRIFVDTPGGYLDTALAFIDAFENTEAELVIVVTGKAYSAGSLIALAGLKYGQLVVGNRARFMLHSGKFGSSGSESEVEANTKNTLSLARDLKKEFYTGFLTTEEMKLLDVGQDYYFDTKESIKRIENRIAYLDEQSKPKPKKQKKVIPKPEYNPQDVAFGSTTK